jgi:hypothetical protein
MYEAENLDTWKLILTKKINISEIAVRIYLHAYLSQPIKMAARCKAWNVFVRSNAGIMGSNPT